MIQSKLQFITDHFNSIDSIIKDTGEYKGLTVVAYYDIKEEHRYCLTIDKNNNGRNTLLLLCQNPSGELVDLNKLDKTIINLINLSNKKKDIGYIIIINLLPKIYNPPFKDSSYKLPIDIYNTNKLLIDKCFTNEQIEYIYLAYGQDWTRKYNHHKLVIDYRKISDYIRERYIGTRDMWCNKSVNDKSKIGDILPCHGIRNGRLEFRCKVSKDEDNKLIIE